MAPSPFWQAELLPGLPPYGPPASSYPESWAKSGHEGVVVRFGTADASTRWVVNLQGHGGGTTRLLSLGAECWLVAARSTVYRVDVPKRQVDRLFIDAPQLWELDAPRRVLLDRQGLAFALLDARGDLLWHTRRLSWDGFRQIEIRGNSLEGEARDVMTQGEAWRPFRVDLRTGRSEGGSYPESVDTGTWEKLAG